MSHLYFPYDGTNTTPICYTRTTTATISTSRITTTTSSSSTHTKVLILRTKYLSFYLTFIFEPILRGNEYLYARFDFHFSVAVSQSSATAFEIFLFQELRAKNIVSFYSFPLFRTYL